MSTSKQSKKSSLPIYAVGAVILIGLATMTAALTGQAPTLDDYGCNTRAQPAGMLAIWIDQTDALSEHQRQAVREIVDARISNARAGDRIVLFGLDSSFDGVAKPLLQVCRPPRRANEANTGATDKYLENRWKPFEAKVDAFVDQLTALRTAPTSPIFEALRAMTFTSEYRASTRRDVVLITDGLENTPGWPEARNASATFAKFGDNQYPKSMSADFRSAHLSLYWLTREDPEGHLQTPSQQAFFQDWLTGQGAVLDASNSLPL